MSRAGLWFRVVGTLLLVATWWVALSGGLLTMVLWGFLGLDVFIVAWFYAAWFDAND